MKTDKKPLCPYCSSTTNHCTDVESETCEEFNPTFNPDAHSSLITDFGKDDVIETIEEAGKKYAKLRNGLNYGQLYSNSLDCFIAGAKSDAARNYWFKTFQEEHTIVSLFQKLRPLEQVEKIQELRKFTQD